MKTVKILSLCLAAMFGLYSCGSDDKDEKKEEKNKVYLVKSLTISEDGDYVKYTFTYENNKIVKWTGVDSDGETDGGTFSYPSAISVNYKGFDGEEEVITLDATENVISKQEGMYSDGEQYKGTYSFVDGYLSKISWNENGSIVYAWSNGNLTTIKDTYIYDDGKEEETSTIAYSDIENKTNIDFCLWLDDAEPIYTIQFMKNVSKNIPSSVKYGTGALSIISTTLDEKGRPSKMVYDGCTYTFEYYD
ncbi:MAG: hypothetical protein J6W37_00600 [Bacteroidales bacterium]|nr:hypothetical protein [Bacteroidales bacterium]